MSKTANPTAASESTAPLVAEDFVYCGRRLTADGKLTVCIAPIMNGELQGQRLFLFDRKAHRVVGGVYRGAKFNEQHMAGLAAPLAYVKRWEVAADLIDWQARDEQAESTVRIKKLEADAKKISEIEKIMLPLRAQFARYKFMRDRGGMDALQSAVLAALGAAPRPEEGGAPRAGRR